MPAQSVKGSRGRCGGKEVRRRISSRIGKEKGIPEFARKTAYGRIIVSALGEKTRKQEISYLFGKNSAAKPASDRGIPFGAIDPGRNFMTHSYFGKVVDKGVGTIMGGKSLGRGGKVRYRTPYAAFRGLQGWEHLSFLLKD